MFMYLGFIAHLVYKYAKPNATIVLDIAVAVIIIFNYI